MKPLYPLMAVLVASATVFPSRTFAGGPTTPSSVATNTDNKNAPNELTAVLLAKPVARKDAGARIAAFMLDADSEGKSFVEPGVDRVGLAAVAKDWAQKEDAGKVAMLYFVIGPARASGEGVVGSGNVAPDWVDSKSILQKVFIPGMKWEKRLRIALGEWTGKSRITKTGEVSAAAAFLNEAAAKAATVFADPRTTTELDESVATYDRGGVKVPSTSGTNNSGLNNASQQYGIDELYRNGAIVSTVFDPAHPEAGSRTISMKIYTRRDAATGDLINEVGVYDITDPNNIYGQRFSMNPGEKTVALDDRTEGHKKYTFKVETGPNGQRNVSFVVEGAKGGGIPAEGGTASVESLLLARADQAQALGNIVKVGGQEFYVVPQGGSKGSLSFLPKSAVDSRSIDNARDLKPTLFAEVSRRNKDGDTVHMDGKPHLGSIGDKEFHLEWNATSGMWEVKDGPGDKPKPPVTTDPNAPPTNSTTTTNGDQPTTAPNQTTDFKDVGEAEAYFLGNGAGWTKDEADNKDISPSLKANVRILNRTVKGEKEYNVVVPKDIAAGYSLQYKSMYTEDDGLTARKDPLKMIRVFGWGKYLILQFDNQQQYLDMTKPDKTNGFTFSGYITKKDGLRQFSDVDALAHGLKTFTALSAADKDAPVKIPQRVKAHAGGKDYKIEAGFTDKGLVSLLVAEGGPWTVWPKDEKTNTPGGPPTASYDGLNGTNAFEGAVSTEAPGIPEADDKLVIVPGTKQSDVALWATKDAPKAYSLMFQFRAMDGGKVKTFRTNFFEIFNDKQGGRPLPKDLQVGGLVAAEPVPDRMLMGYAFVSGSSAEKGVLAVYKNKQITGPNVTKKGANCAGPVAWWGVGNRDAALAICKADKF